MTLTQKIAVTVTAIAASLVVAAGVTAGIRHHKGKPVCPECITKLFSTKKEEEPEEEHEKEPEKKPETEPEKKPETEPEKKPETEETI